MRRWLMTWGGRWLSSHDDSLECPDLVKRLPCDLINDAAVVDDRFSEAADGMFIVWDLFGIEGEAEDIWWGSSISVKDLNADVDSFGCGSSVGISVDTLGRGQIIAHQQVLSNKAEAVVEE